MQQAPDLSKIVSLIMQNPSLISEIAALASSSEEATESTESVEKVTAAPTEREAKAVVEDRDVKTVARERTHIESRTRRKELLNAMKPYLSEPRRGAIDSMSSILDILDVMIKKET